MRAERRSLRWGVLLACAATVGAVTAGGCADPTAIRVAVFSEIPCDTQAEVSIALAGDAPSLGRAAPAAVATRCENAEGGSVRRGEVVITPQGDKEKLVAFQITTRDDHEPTEACANGFSRCIAARRELLFQKHSEVDVRVDLRRSCLGIVCEPDQTCVKGSCVTARLPVACNPCVEPEAGGRLATRVCGDTSGVPADSPWPMVYGCPTNAGRSPLLDGPSSGATALAPTGDLPDIKGAVITGSDKAVVQTRIDGVVAGITLPAGEAKWKNTAVAGNGSIPNGALDNEGGVVFTTNYGKVFCLDAETGAERWQIQLSGYYSPPVIGPPGVMYFGSQNYGVYAVDTKKHAQKWNFSSMPNNGNTLAAPALGDGLLYVVETTENHLHALDAETGTERFNVAIGGTATGAAVLGLGAVFVATTDHGITAFDARSGATKWQHELGYPALQPALLANGDLVVAAEYTDNGAVVVLDQLTGAVLRTLPVKGRTRLPPIVGARDTIYFTSDTGTTAISPANVQLWQSTLFGPLRIAKSGLVVLPGDTTTIALIGP